MNMWKTRIVCVIDVFFKHSKKDLLVRLHRSFQSFHKVFTAETVEKHAYGQIHLYTAPS